jgi:hypothetical protein
MNGISEMNVQNCIKEAVLFVEYVLLWLEVSLNAVPCFLVVAVRSI